MTAGETPSIAGLGAYAPRFRLPAAEVREALGGFRAPGIEATAVPDADEDALTMAVAAARRALDAGGRAGGEVTSISLATTTPPLAEEDLTPRLASALGAPATVRTRTLTGSTRAGGQALDAAIDAGPPAAGVALVIASDCPRGAPDSPIQHAAGAGAVALLLDADGPGRVTDRASAVEPYPGTRFRPAGGSETTGLDITQYDRESFTAVLSGAAADLGPPPADGFDAAAVQAPDGSLPDRAPAPLDVDRETVEAGLAVESLGDTGAASAFLGLEAALERGADTVLLATYGSGAGATLVAFDGMSSVPIESALEGDTELTYPEALRRRGTLAREAPEGGGAYVSVPTWQRTYPQRHRLVAGACPDCGALAFPPEGACTACGTLPEEYDDVVLPGTGTVEATTTIARGGAPPEFVTQQSRGGSYDSAIVAFDGPEGDRTVSVPVQVVRTPAAEVPVGARVTATVRRIYEQEGVIRYGCKVRPVDAR